MTRLQVGGAGWLLLLLLGAVSAGGAAPFSAAPAPSSDAPMTLLSAFPAGEALEAQAPPSSTPPGQIVIPDPDQFEATAPTDDPELEAQVRKLARQLRCPTCQALSIADSPSELAREMEGVIRYRLEEGMTPAEVRLSFVEAYGEWILLSPDPSGFNLLVYLLPLGVLLVGGGIVTVAIRRWVVDPVPGGDPSQPDDSEHGGRDGEPAGAERVPSA